MVNRIRISLVIFLVLVGPAFSADPVKVDVGGGVIQQDLESGTGGSGFDPVGLFGTVGWSFPNGFLLRLTLSRSEDESLAFADLGFGLEVALEQADFTRLAFVAGYMFKRGGLVRPYLHAGLARLLVEDDFTGQASGASATLIDDDDTVIALGAGVEIGQDHHVFIINLDVDQEREVDSALGEVDLNLTEIRFGYVYRF